MALAWPSCDEGNLVEVPGLEPRSFPDLGIMGYKPTALPLSYISKIGPS